MSLVVKIDLSSYSSRTVGKFLEINVIKIPYDIHFLLQVIMLHIVLQKSTFIYEYVTFPRRIVAHLGFSRPISQIIFRLSLAELMNCVEEEQDVPTSNVYDDDRKRNTTSLI